MFVKKLFFEVTFQQFLIDHSEWKENNGAVLFWESQTQNFHRAMLVLRIQNTGLCYMHATTVLQHYLLCIYRIKHGKELDFKMVNVALFISDKWKGNVLLQYLNSKDGGSSIEFFRKINNIQINYRRLIFKFIRYLKS
jgi:hypothetical protein